MITPALAKCVNNIKAKAMHGPMPRLPLTAADTATAAVACPACNSSIQDKYSSIMSDYQNGVSQNITSDQGIHFSAKYIQQ
jgi:hypothetical protein